MALIAVIADLHFDIWTRWAVDPLTATGLDIVIHRRQPDLLVLAGDLSNDAVSTLPTVLTRLGRLIPLEKSSSFPATMTIISADSTGNT